MRVLLVSANRERLPTTVLPLGMLTVASAARQRHELALLDLCFEPDVERALAAAIGDLRPEAIALGIRNLHTNSYDGTEAVLEGLAQIAATIRGLSPAPLIVGGSGFSLRPDPLLACLRADHGVVGEGERSFPALLDALAAHQRPPRLVTTPVEAPARGRAASRWALDHVPHPAYDLVDPRYFSEGDGTVNVQTKRGCAFACNYCDYPDLEGRTIRMRDPEVVASEIACWAAVPGVSSLFFVDSVFNVPRWHALAVCRALIARGLSLPWLCYASPVGVDEELVETMAQAGCVGVEIGSDTGTEASLRRLNKPFGLDAIRRAHRLFSAAGIADCHTFVIGAENEDVSEAHRTLAFVEELDPDVAVFVVFHEDRQERGVGGAAHRDALRALLGKEAPRRPGWVVPELGIRFGDKVTRLLARQGVRGSSWLRLAQLRRRVSARGQRAE